MAVARRVRVLALAARGVVHQLRPQSCRQVWLSVLAVPLAALVVGLAL